MRAPAKNRVSLVLASIVVTLENTKADVMSRFGWNELVHRGEEKVVVRPFYASRDYDVTNLACCFAVRNLFVSRDLSRKVNPLARISQFLTTYYMSRSQMYRHRAQMLNVIPSLK